ncbi:maleylpyruvate isomerase family mycothiol-dependent enzyme [Dermacoccaceae bacterium W4C1]
MSEEMFGLIAAQRRRLADLADDFTEQQWQTPSLAQGWRVQDVFAHLTMPFEVRVPAMVLGVIRHRGSFDAFADAWARQCATRSSGPELASTLRAQAQARFTPPFMGPAVPLTDLVVHGLDVTVPLGLPHSDLDPAALQVALETLSSKAGQSFGVARGALEGSRWEATDVDWSHGEESDPAVHAEAADLLLHFSRGRPLPGDGAQ